MNVLSDRIINLTESATLRMAALARELQQKGVNVINLSLGEPDFQTPWHIREEGIRHRSTSKMQQKKLLTMATLFTPLFRVI